MSSLLFGPDSSDDESPQDFLLASAASERAPASIELKLLELCVIESDAAQLQSLLDTIESFDDEEVCEHWGALQKETLRLASLVADGEYVEALQSPLAVRILATLNQSRAPDARLRIRNLADLIRPKLSAFVTGDDESDEEGEPGQLPSDFRAAAALFTAAACLGLFVQSNWTGPPVSMATVLPLLPTLFTAGGATATATATDQQQQVAEAEEEGEEEAPGFSLCQWLLQTDGEPLYEQTDVPHCLATARALLLALHARCPVVDDAATAAGKQGQAVAAGGSGSSELAMWARPSPAVLSVSGRAQHLTSLAWWSARASLCHQRCLVSKQPCLALVRETELQFNEARARLGCPATPLLHSMETALSEHRHYLTDTDAAATAATAPEGEGEGEESEGAAAAAATPPPPPPPPLFPEASRWLRGRVWLETGLAQHHSGNVEGAKLSFHSAQYSTGLRARLSGALGKRTKFQKFSNAQMLVVASSVDEGALTTTATDAAAAAATDAAADADGNATADSGAAAATPAAGDGEEKATGEGEGEGEGAGKGSVATAVPREYVRDADTALLERVALTDEAAAEVAAEEAAEGRQQKLVPLDQAVLLGICLDVKNSSPEHGLTREEMMAYVSRVLERASNWSVHTAALRVKSMLECEHNRSRERAVLQMQALVDQHSGAVTPGMLAGSEIAAPVRERMAFVHCLALPPLWAMKRDLGERYLKMGVVYSALQIFESLGLWEDVALCLVAVKRTEEATALIRRLLRLASDAAAQAQDTATTAAAAASLTLVAQGGAGEEEEAELAEEKGSTPSTYDFKNLQAPSPSSVPVLWCVLGDIAATDDAKQRCYLTAWRLSQQRCSRAMRSLGGLCFARGRYSECMAHLRAALRVHPLFPSTWFRMGAAAMREEQWATALSAFTHVVQQRPTDGQAWGNLGAIYSRVDKRQEAYLAFAEAVKHKRDSWRMWENLLLVSLECRRFADAITAMHRLLDLRHRDRHTREREGSAGAGQLQGSQRREVDTQALLLLVRAVTLSMVQERDPSAVAALLQSKGADAAVAIAAAVAAPAATADGSSSATAAGEGKSGEEGEEEEEEDSMSLLARLQPCLGDSDSDDDDAATAGGGSGGGSGGRTTAVTALFDYQGNPSRVYRAQLSKLLARVSSAVRSDAVIWEACAMFHAACGGQQQQVVDCRLKQVRALQVARWEREMEHVTAVTQAASSLVSAYLDVGSKQALSAARMFLRGAISRVALLFADSAPHRTLCALQAEVQLKLAALNTE